MKTPCKDPCSLRHCKLKNKQSISETITDIKPDTIIHSAALTNVDECEKNKKLAEEINVVGTKSIGTHKVAQSNSGLQILISDITTMDISVFGK